MQETVDEIVAALEAGSPDLARTLAESAATAASPSTPSDLRAQLYHLLGGACSLLGDDHAAACAFAQALEFAPDSDGSRLYLGITLSRLGDSRSALPHFDRLLHTTPDNIPALQARALAFQRLGENGRALADYHCILDHAPQHYPALLGAGEILCALERREEARKLLHAAQELQPSAAACIGLGMSFLPHSPQEAQAWFARAHALDPADARALDGLSFVHKERGEYRMAHELAQRAVELSSRAPEFLHSLALLARALGESETALALLRECVDAAPEKPEYHSALLLTAEYTSLSRPEIFSLHQEWGKRFAAPDGVPVPAKAPRDRPPRLGFVSPDLCAHPVAFFLEGLLRGLRQLQVPVFAYSCGSINDAVSQRLRGLCTGWREIRGLSDNETTKLIAEDGIDVLIDLAGHTPQSRLRLFSLRPAPLQISWLGYPDTSGTIAIDARLTDAIADPSGAEEFHTERLLRLPGGFLCYTPAPDAPAPVAPPCLSGQPLTFGSFNNLAKIGEECVRLWSGVLRRVPGAHLLLKSDALADDWVCRRLRERFAACGVAPERLLLLGKIPDFAAHLAQYGRMDIALDTFPYNGTTTTFDAMYMGVPVITLAGAAHRSRVGASILNPAGLTDLMAHTPDEFADIAAGLASAPQRLEVLRAGMRGMLAPLCDATDFARRFLRAIEDAR